MRAGAKPGVLDGPLPIRWGHDEGVSIGPQPVVEIRSYLERLSGHEIASLQVLGINSLKSVSPPPIAMAGQLVTDAEVSERIITVMTTDYVLTIDLQRTGKLVWFESATAFSAERRDARPTVRLMLTNGRGIDLTEPAKTKRITVALRPRAA
jgi:hypothetical protein